MKHANSIGSADMDNGERRSAPRSQTDGAASPFFWWVRILLLAFGALTVFPVVFAVVVTLLD